VRVECARVRVCVCMCACARVRVCAFMPESMRAHTAAEPPARNILGCMLHRSRPVLARRCGLWF
jgi:hypothetical protein